MSETVSVIVGTFGDDEWKKMAEKAMASARAQSVQPDFLIHSHAVDLATARNEGANMCQSKWLIFLDADDTLDPEYVKEMLVDDPSTLRQPATLGVYPDGTTDPEANMIPERPLTQSNFMVIGTMCLREQFLAVGGFDPSLPVLEDWDLWLRITRAGGVIGKRPKAIYRVGVNPGSRNMQARDVGARYYEIIRNRYR